MLIQNNTFMACTGRVRAKEKAEMKDILKALLSSKKFLVLLATVIAWVVGKVGFEMSADDIQPVLVAVASYLVGQGIADFGKESTKEAARSLGKSETAS